MKFGCELACVFVMQSSYSKILMQSTKNSSLPQSTGQMGGEAPEVSEDIKIKGATVDLKRIPFLNSF